MSERALIERQRQEQVKKEAELPPRPARIAAIDPGTQQDSFAMVGIECDRKDIFIIGATQWKHQDYPAMEEQVAVIHKTIVNRPFDHIAVEVNNTGLHVYQSMRRMGLPVIPVNTVRELKDPKKIMLGNSMNKIDMVHWMKRMLLLGKIQFPKPEYSSPGTRLLQNQMPKFTRKRTPSGKLSYAAQGREHDDLVMALLIACYVARRKYLRSTGKLVIQQSRYKFKKKYNRIEDYMPEMQNLGGGFAKIRDITVVGSR